MIGFTAGLNENLARNATTALASLFAEANYLAPKDRMRRWRFGFYFEKESL